MKGKYLYVCAVLWTVLCLLPGPALAGTLEQLDRADSLTATVSGLTFTQLNASDKGLSTLNAFLAPLSVRVGVGTDTARLAVLSGESELASLSLGAEAWPDQRILPHEALKRVFDEALPALFDACCPEEGAPEPELRNASVRRLPRSTQRTTLTITPAQFAAAEGALAVFRDCVACLDAHLSFAEDMNEWLDGIAAASDLTLKRLEDAEGKAIAWQLTGRVTSGAKDTRQLTLYGGIDGMNAYISLKLPARAGKNNLQLTVDLAYKAGRKENSWSGTVTFKRVKDGDSVTIKDTVSLKNALSGGESLSGSVKRAATENGIKSVWTLKPDLQGDGTALRGTVSLTKKHAQTQVWQAKASLSLSPGMAENAAESASAVQFVSRLLASWNAYRGSLPDDTRRQLDHMLRTDDWMNGTVYPANRVPTPAPTLVPTLSPEP